MNDNYFNHSHFICACEAPQHTLHFIWDPDDDSINITVHLDNRWMGFWKRLKVGIYFIFGKKAYPKDWSDWDVFILNKTEALKLANSIQEYYKEDHQ
jgi:hypothetical protein